MALRSNGNQTVSGEGTEKGLLIGMIDEIFSVRPEHFRMQNQNRVALFRYTGQGGLVNPPTTLISCRRPGHDSFPMSTFTANRTQLDSHLSSMQKSGRVSHAGIARMPSSADRINDWSSLLRRRMGV